MFKYAKLFEPMNIGKVEIKNKTSMAPMGPVGYADAYGGFNQRLQDYYVERAKNDVGLIFTGICSVDMGIEGIPSNGLPCPTTNPLGFIHSTYSMNERIHAHGAKIFLQLTGGLGRCALPGFVSNPIAPSEQSNRFNPNVMHREITKEEIMQLIQQFAKSAAIAKKAGFDGVEIHAVHEGYLLDQFAIELFNKRTDEFGGSLENRLRVSTEIVKSIKKVCGEDFPVSLRYSLKSCMKDIRQGGLPGEEYQEVGKDIEEGIEGAKLLVNAGYDALNVDAGTYDSWYWNHPPTYFEDGMYREFGEALKEHVEVPIILAGRMDNPEMAEEALGKSCDMISYGRALLADPEFVTKIKYNRVDEIRPCVGCHEGCLGRISEGPISCAVNPSCGREEIYGLTPALRKKKILIIGGGLAGMEVARVSALRGHEVVLCEKSDRLGGNIIPGSVPNFKRYDRKLVAYYEKQLELLEVEVQKNTAIEKSDIEKYSADIIVTATGSSPKSISLPGTRKPVIADQVLLGKEPVGQNVVMIGGGLVGVETALWLAQQGKKVSVLEISPEILGGHNNLPHMNYFMLIDLLKFHHVDVYESTSVIDTKNGTIDINHKGENITLTADTIVTSVGYKENNSLYSEIKDLETPVYNIGDSSKVRNIMYAIWNGYELSRNL